MTNLLKALSAVIVFASLVGISTHSFGQDVKREAPAYKKIRSAIKKKDSNFFYPDLMARFRKRDTTLTPEEFTHLYYGYVFQPEYKAHWVCDYSDSLRKVKVEVDSSSQTMEKVLAFSWKCLDGYPFDYSSLNYQVMALKKLGKEEEAQKTIRAVRRLIRTILSTGRGLEKGDAMHVISIDHEYMILGLFDFEMKSQGLIEMKYDYMRLEPNDSKVEGLYFNIEKMMEAEMKMFEE